MKPLPILFHPSDRQLRQFGLTALFALPLAAGLCSHGNLKVVLDAAAAGALIAVSGLVYPRGLKPLCIALSLLAWPIGIVVNELLMAVMFFAVFVPLGLIFRCLGRDALQRKLDRDADSYWQPKPPPKDAASYFRRW